MAGQSFYYKTHYSSWDFTSLPMGEHPKKCKENFKSLHPVVQPHHFEAILNGTLSFSERMFYNKQGYNGRIPNEILINKQKKL
jgi:hypothetical protein